MPPGSTALLAAFGAPLTEIVEADFVAPDLVVQIGVEPNRIDILTSIDGVEFDAAWLEAAIALRSRYAPPAHASVSHSCEITIRRLQGSSRTPPTMSGW